MSEQKPVSEMTAIELLRELANALQWPAWFDTSEGEEYAKEVRPRLYAIAQELEELAALANPSRPGIL